MRLMKNHLRESCLEAVEATSLGPIREYLKRVPRDRFATHRASLNLLSAVDEAKLFGLIHFFFKDRRVRGIVSEGDFLMHTLATNYAVEHLLYRMTGDSKKYKKSAVPLMKAGCVLCGVKTSKTFCQPCISFSTKKQRWEWHTALELISISETSNLRSFAAESLEVNVGNGFPIDLLIEKLPIVKSPIMGFKVTQDQGKILAILRQKPDLRSDYLLKLLGNVATASLSDSQLLTWLYAAPVFQQREEFPGRQKAIDLCAANGIAIEDDLVGVAKRTFPDWQKLKSDLLNIDRYWLSLTLSNDPTQKLFRNWNSPDLYSFRRALNLDDMELLKTTDTCNPEFLSLLNQEALTLSEVKQLISKSHFGFAKVLKHSRILSPEEFLAWLAATSYPKLKLAILKNPTKEIENLHNDFLAERRKLLSRPSSGRVRPASSRDLGFYEPQGGGKVSLGYQQKSWRKRFWS